MRCLQERIANIKLDGTVDKNKTHTHARVNTTHHARTHARARKGIYIISLIIFKSKVKDWKS